MGKFNLSELVNEKFKLIETKYNFRLIEYPFELTREQVFVYYNETTHISIHIYTEYNVIIYILINKIKLNLGLEDNEVGLGGYSLFEYVAEFTNGDLTQKDFAISKIKYDPFYTFEEKFEYYSSDVDLYIEILDKYLGDVLLGKKWIYPRTMRLFYKIKSIFK